MVYDPHTHAWGPPSREHPWVNGPIVDLVDDFAVDTAYTGEKLLADMDAAGIDRATVVGYPIYEWTDNAYTVDVVQRQDRLDGIVMVDVFAEDAAEQIREYVGVEGIHGIRLGAICPYDRMWETFDTSVDWLRDAIAEDAVWEALAETDGVVQILCDTSQLDQALELVETYPELTYLFDHFAHADPELAPAESDFARFADLAEYDVGVKVSEAPHHSKQAFPYADLHDHVHWLLEHFGRERVLWGSDYPNVSDAATYEESLTWLEHVDGLTTADRRWLTERAADRVFG
jgi:predicted TIM-barrel fold metal-dependent hydrolase